MPCTIFLRRTPHWRALLSLLPTRFSLLPALPAPETGFDAVYQRWVTSDGTLLHCGTAHADASAWEVLVAASDGGAGAGAGAGAGGARAIVAIDSRAAEMRLEIDEIAVECGCGQDEAKAAVIAASGDHDEARRILLGDNQAQRQAPSNPSTAAEFAYV